MSLRVGGGRRAGAGGVGSWQIWECVSRDPCRHTLGPCALAAVSAQAPSETRNSQRDGVAGGPASTFPGSCAAHPGPGPSPGRRLQAPSWTAPDGLTAGSALWPSGACGVKRLPMWLRTGGTEGGCLPCDGGGGHSPCPGSPGGLWGPAPPAVHSPPPLTLPLVPGVLPVLIHHGGGAWA